MTRGRRTNKNPQLSLIFPVLPPSLKGAPTRGQTHRVAGLFAGIGGLEHGLHRSGHKTLLLCENDMAAATVLATRFPGVRIHDDICTLTELPRDTTLVAAGFPCQDLSQAGKTGGISGARSGLVEEVFRLIDTYRTPWVLLENVPFMLQLGSGRAMELIARTFEKFGYRWAYRVVDSRAFGLPQRRRRVYFLATREGDPRSVLFADDAEVPEEGAENGPTIACGFYWTEGIRGLGWAINAVPTLKGGSTVGIPSAPAILLPTGEVVMPDIRDAERLQGFPTDWTKPAEQVTKRGVRWKLVGNAVTVPAAHWLGRRLMKPGRLLDFDLGPLRPREAWPTAAWNVDGQRVSVDASEWPLRHQYRSLAEFLRFDPIPLSARATAGFLARTDRSRLRFPPHLIPALRIHLRRVSGGLDTTKRRGTASDIAAVPLG